jgi:BlaI family transcriptional regulator, penicillinase repressor
MDPDQPPSLSKRERQIMDVLHRRGRASAAEITGDLDDAPTNTTVRTLLRILVEKGHVRFERDGRLYVYRPVADRDEAGASMMTYVVRTFFGGSPARAMAALLGRERDTLTAAQLDRLERLLAEARERPE